MRGKNQDPRAKIQEKGSSSKSETQNASSGVRSFEFDAWDFPGSWFLDLGTSAEKRRHRLVNLVEHRDERRRDLHRCDANDAMTRLFDIAAIIPQSHQQPCVRELHADALTQVARMTDRRRRKC